MPIKTSSTPHQNIHYRDEKKIPVKEIDERNKFNEVSRNETTEKNIFQKKSLLSPKPLHRRPIHDIRKEYEEENYKNKLYPDLSNDLEALQPPERSCDKEKEQKKRYKSKPPTAEKPNDDTDSSGIFKCIKYIVLLSVIVFFGIFTHSYYFSSKSSFERNTNLIDVLNDLQNHFQEQKYETFKVLKSALKDVFNEKYEPSAPAIVTIITKKTASHRASDFSLYLAKSLAPGQYVSINESAFYGDPDDLKFKIDNEIKSKLQKKWNLSVVVVDNLQNIPFEAAMLFHNYCDHENAPYKRVVFLFILHLDMNISDNNYDLKYLDEVAIKGMRNIWQKFSSDEVDSLITRMAVSVVKIK